MTDDDPLSLAELLALIRERLEPSVEHGRVWFGQLRIEHDLSTATKLLGQPPLPMRSRSMIPEAVEDEIATGCRVSVGCYDLGHACEFTARHGAGMNGSRPECMMRSGHR